MQKKRFHSLYLLLIMLVGCLSYTAQAQNISVIGTVVDEAGDPLTGVTIKVLGNNTLGAMTDINGEFKINAPKESVLRFSFVGFKPVDISLKGAVLPLKVIMKEDQELLEEVVVVGYAKGSKRTISGAVASLSAKDMNAGMVVNPLQSLQGKVPGVNIRKVGGDPTAGASIRIRGTTSLSGGNDPLVIVDGIYGDLSMLNALSPNDIANITILKDASETAQYGSRGAAGVIVVTTMKGKAGSKILTYNGSFGVESAYKTIGMLSAADFRRVTKELGMVNALDGGASTDFMKEMLQTGYTQEHRVSYGGGSELGSFRASLGVMDQKGIIKTNGLRNYSMKIDGSQKFYDNKLQLEASMFGAMREARFVNDYQKTFYSAASSNPTLPATQNADGTWPEDPNANEIHNPLGRLTIQDRTDNALLTATGRLTWYITPAINLSLFGSYTYKHQENKMYIPNNIKLGINEGRGRAYRASGTNKDLLGNATLSYTKSIGAHRIDALAVAELQRYAYEGFGVNVRGFDTNFFGYNNLAAGALLKYGDADSYTNEYTLNSYLARINYIYADKYIATANVRYDGSSKLGANNKWGFFPSASFAWVISQEGFLKDVRSIDDLKLRVGYGVTGNQDAISPYNSLRLMVPSPNRSLTTIDGVPTVPFSYNRNENPELRWETKHMFDAGVDLSMYEGRFTAVLDYYYSKTSNLLYNYSVPVPPFVHPNLLANLGEMENSGVELSLGVTPIRTEEIELTITGNATYQRNRLLSLSGTYNGQELSASKYMVIGGINGAGFIGGNNNVVYQLVGQPLGVFYLPKSNGIINDGFGSYSYNKLDLDGNSVVDISDGKDRYIAGQAMPKVLIGGNINLRYKSFDVQMQLNGAFGHKIYNGTSLTYMNMNTFPTYNVLPDAIEKKIYDNTVTDYWLENGDYVHIDYISLGYNFKAKGLQNIRVTASVNNIATFTAYSGLSPLINNSTVSGDLGIDDKRFYPLTRTYSVGLNLTF